MPIQIANPTVVAKIERLSRLTGMGKTAAVENAVDRLLGDLEGFRPNDDAWSEFEKLLAQMDRIPEVDHPFNPLDWDEQGLPR